MFLKFKLKKTPKFSATVTLQSRFDMRNGRRIPFSHSHRMGSTTGRGQTRK